MPLRSIDMPGRYLSRFNIHILKEIQVKWRRRWWWWWWCLSQFSTKHVSLSTYEAPCEHVAFTKENLSKNRRPKILSCESTFFLKKIGHPVIQYIMVHPILWVCQPIELSCAPLNSTCVCVCVLPFQGSPKIQQKKHRVHHNFPTAFR